MTVHRVSPSHFLRCGPPALVTKGQPAGLHFCKYPALELATGPSTEVLAAM